MRKIMFLLLWALIVGTQGCNHETRDDIDDLDHEIESDIEGID